MNARAAPPAGSALAPAASTHQPFLTALVASTFAAALAVRLAAIATVYRWVDSDQVVVGLMARHILQGDRPVFYAAQSYNGALEAYLTALPVAVWGATDVSIRLVPVTLSAAFAALGAGLAARCGSRLTGVLTGAYLAAGPPLLLRWTTNAGAGYVEPLLLGTLLFTVAASRPWSGRRSALRAATVGLLLGLGLWADPLVLPYIATLGAVALPALYRGTLRLSFQALLALVGGTLVGLAPVLAASGPAGLAGLIGLDSTVPEQGNALLIRLDAVRRLVTEAGPVLLGCILPGIDAASFTAEVAHHAFLYGLGVLLALGSAALILAPRAVPATARRVVAGRGTLPDLLLLSLPVSLVLFLLSHVGTLPWATREPRYLLPVYTATGAVLGLVLVRPRYERAAVRAEQTGGRATGAIAALCVGGMIAMNMAGLAREQPDIDVRPLTHVLLTSGTEVVFTDYWLGYRLTFESGERLVAVAIWPDSSVGPYRSRNRFPAYLRRARVSRHVAWVVPQGRTDSLVRRLLAEHRAHARRAIWDGFAIYTAISPPLRPPDLDQAGSF